MLGILIAILLAALAYWLCVVLGLPVFVGIVAAILVLLGTAGGLGGRFS
jgi:biotin transporter BioY